MGSKQKKNYSGKIRFSAIVLQELWGKLGLTQTRSQEGLNEWGEMFSPPSQFMNDESRLAFEAFRVDFSEMSSEISSEKSPSTEGEIFIPEIKGSLFIWALLFEIGKEKELSSLRYVFKDEVTGTILQKGRELGILFEAGDFDEICSYLQTKRLIRTSVEGVRITPEFHHLFHKKFGAWLDFSEAWKVKSRDKSACSDFYYFFVKTFLVL